MNINSLNTSQVRDTSYVQTPPTQDPPASNNARPNNISQENKTPQDNASFQKLPESSFDPSSSQVKFGPDEPESKEEGPKRVNMLTPLIGAIALLAGGAAGGAANDSLYNAVQSDLNKASQFINKNGMSYKMGIVGNAEEDQERFKRLSETPKKP